MSKVGATHEYLQLTLLNKDRAIKELVICTNQNALTPNTPWDGMIIYTDPKSSLIRSLKHFGDIYEILIGMCKLGCILFQK